MGGINAFFSEALSLIPQDQVLTMFFAKMEESNAFSSFLEKINASDYENLTESLKVSESDCFLTRNHFSRCRSRKDCRQSTLTSTPTASTSWSGRNHCEAFSATDVGATRHEVNGNLKLNDLYTRM
jgi:Insect allergen related repeat, nitrile-specifier detoxification